MADITTGLIRHWKLNGNLTDETGTANGTFPVGTPTYTTGIINQCLVLNGTTEYVSFTGITGITSVSIAAWVYHKSDEANAAIVGNHQAQSVLIFGHSSTTSLGFRQDGGTGVRFSGAAPPINEWHHICATYNSSTTSVSMYVDGSSVAAAQTVTLQWDSSANYRIQYIGRNNTTATDPGNYLDANIEDVRIYNRALLSEDVAELATVSSGSNTSSSYYYRMI